MRLVEVDGNAMQTTYSGKNLLSNIPYRTGGTFYNASVGTQVVQDTSSAVSIAITNTGFTVSSTAGWQGGWFLAEIEENKNYWVHYTQNGSNARSTTYTLDSTYTVVRNLGPVASDNYTASKAVATQTGEKYIALTVGCGLSNTTVNAIEPQVELASDYSSYEPYVGGTASPNPDYPQDINVVTGTQAVKITGKNLAWTGWAQDFVTRINNSGHANIEQYDGKQCLMILPRAGYGDYDNKYLFKTNFKENTQYTFSFDEYTADQFTSLAVVYTDGTVEVVHFGSAGYDTWEHVTKTTTANKTVKYMRADWQGGQKYIDIDSFMVEEGTSASSFEPYQGQEYPIDLGSIELAKIGTYQDYIFNDNGTWKIHKEVGKVVLNGTETGWGVQNDCFIRDFSDALQDTTGYTEILVVSDHFIGRTTCYRGELVSGKCAKIIGTNQQVGFRYDALNNDVDAWKTWLGTHNTTVYYALATPTDTEITEQALIDQLEAVAELYGGPNYVSFTGTGAQGEIAVEYQTWDKYNRYDVYIWNDEINDYQILNS